MLRTLWDNLLRGRNGFDSFSRFLIVTALVAMIADMIVGGSVLGQFLRIISLLLLLYACFRVFSCNIAARQRELIRFNIFVRECRYRYGKAVSLLRNHNIKEILHFKYFTCPACGQKLRVPRGKGKINVRCSRCGERFLSRS